jgi:hypothetical protein
MSQESFVAKSYIPAVDPVEADLGSSAAAPSGGAAAMLKWLNRIVAGTLVVFLGAFAWSAVQTKLPAKGKRPQSGIDWMLWASGSNETFSSAMQKKIEASTRELEDQFKKSQVVGMEGLQGGSLKFDGSAAIDFSRMLSQPQPASSKTRRR